ncbi:MAG: immunoglobulin domain-containing protein [Verrucomicrobiota bacterium]
MFPMLRRLRPQSFFGLTVVLGLLFLTVPPVRAVVRDGGIDSLNLGKGTWIYILPNAINNLGVGNIASVTNNASLMVFLKNQGLQHVIVKAAQGDTFNSQFSTSLVGAAHAAGLKIFGYIYTTGVNIPGEVTVVGTMFQRGADGVVFDGEGEWKILADKEAKAMQLFSTVRANWPNKFLAHSPYAYQNYHTTFPFKEFGYYVDSVMPQNYFIEFGDTPTLAVSTMNTQYRNWQNSLGGSNSVVGGTNYYWTNSIKPLTTIGQGWTSTNGTITPALINEFYTALKTVSNPATAGGYKGVNFWRAELHPANIWDAIRTNAIGKAYTNAPVVEVAPVLTIGATNVSVVWPTDQLSDSVMEYGLSTSYGSATTNATLLWYHTVNVTGLTPNTTYHYRVKSNGTNNLTGVSSDYVFTTASASFSDVIVESRLASGVKNSNPPYTDAGCLDSTAKSTAGGLTGTGSRYATGGSGTPSCTFKPTLPASGGTFDVYITHTPTSCSSDITATIAQSGCSGLPSTTTAFRSTSGANSWTNVGRIVLNAGVTVPTLTFTYSSGTLDATSRMYGDAVKFVYVPPSPSAPSIATQPVAQTLNRGDSATFFVVASGTAPITYQWKFQGTNISGETNSAYTRNTIQSSDAGNYSVSLTNSVGQMNSSNALLTVNQYPTITSSPTNATRSVGSEVTFSVIAIGTAPMGYQWKFNDVEIPGATSTNYTRTNLQNSDGGTYSVSVTNMAGSATASAQLVVESPLPPQITSIIALPSGEIRLQVTGAPGNYFIDAATDFSGWATLTNIVNTNGSIEFIDPTTNLPIRFYRARSSP